MHKDNYICLVRFLHTPDRSLGDLVLCRVDLVGGFCAVSSRALSWPGRWDVPQQGIWLGRGCHKIEGPIQLPWVL